MISFFVEYKYLRINLCKRYLNLCLQLVVAYGPVDQRANRAESARAGLYLARLVQTSFRDFYLPNITKNLYKWSKQALKSSAKNNQKFQKAKEIFYLSSLKIDKLKSIELDILQSVGWSKVKKSIEITNKIYKKSPTVGPGRPVRYTNFNINF